VSKLDQLLTYLGRNEAQALVFRTGNPVKLQTINRVMPLTAGPLSSAQIRRFFEGTEAAIHIPEYDEDDATRELELVGRPFAVTIGQLAGILEIRVCAVLPTENPRARAAKTPTRDIPTSELSSRPEPSKAVPLPTRPFPTHSLASEPDREPRPALATNELKAASSQLAQLLSQARQHGASDVHLTSNSPARVRRLGALEPVNVTISHDRLLAMLEPLLGPRDSEQLRDRGYADLSITIEGAGRLRVNVCRQRTGLKVCFRLIVSQPPDIETLGLPPEVRKLTLQHQGLAIVSGPSGHGKTTTMSALVDMFNASKSDHIITVEDPVEVLHPRKQAIVTQREVGAHTESFQTALAASLREDPDVIAIGELRDRETVAMALAASETGHLVLATMSTPSASKTIGRLIDLFPPDDQSQVKATLAGALKLILSQRLLRRADGRGMVAAFEMVTGNIPLWTLIRDDKLFQLPSLLQRGRSYGMIRLEDSLVQLLHAGVITEDEAFVFAEDRRAIENARPAPAPTAAETAASGGRFRFGRGTT